MDLNAIEKNLLKLDEYPLEKWNPELCEGAEFKIDGNAHWHYNNSKIERASMVKLFSKLIKWEEGKYYAVTPVEKIPIVVEKEVFSVIDYKREGGDYFFQTNTEEWVKLTKKQPLTVEMINHQPYPKIKLREHIYGLLSRNVFYKIISESKQDGKAMYLESDGEYFYLNS